MSLPKNSENKKETLAKIKQNWEEFAKRDPLWSILPYPEKKGNRWNIEDLFATGQKEIALIMAYLSKLNIKTGNERALDFGCGVGRLTQALARYFQECIGVDISTRMLELAEQYNQLGQKCKYILNCSNNLKIFDDNTFDFIYSNIVFQHLPPVYTLSYLKEFIRVIKPRGVIVFQITTEQVNTLDAKMRSLVKRIVPEELRRFYKRLKYGTWAIKDMYCIKEETLNSFIVANNGKILDVTEDTSSLPRYKGKRYCVSKLRGLPRS